MSALLEVFRAVALFSLFFLVIPVGVFVLDIWRNLKRKEVRQNAVERGTKANQVWR
jgi:hypothetical protein